MLLIYLRKVSLSWKLAALLNDCHRSGFPAADGAAGNPCSHLACLEHIPAHGLDQAEGAVVVKGMA